MSSNDRDDAEIEAAGHAATHVANGAADITALYGELTDCATSAWEGGLAKGARIGGFVVVEPLGQGGMGIVVAADDPHLDRRVAIKVLRLQGLGGGSTEMAQQRLLREARAMAKLSHPNVLTVHEVGTMDDQVFVAMEFAAGGTLGDWLAAGERPWRELLELFVKAGRGLAAAHEAGMVHRDFKPHNVLLTKTGEVKVADFGLVGVRAARAAEPDPDGDQITSTMIDATLTFTGDLMGTPAYMAPEQHRREIVGARADQFAFCVALYEALYGERPFAGETYQELATNVVDGKLRDPPAESPVPGWLGEVVARGLATDPADRHESMHALIAELHKDPAAFRRRRRTAVTIAVLLAALLGGLAFALLRSGADRSQLCASAEGELVGVWNDDSKAQVRAAFAATGRHYAADTFIRVERILDTYAIEWIAMNTAACRATHIADTQSDQILDLRMQCLARRRAELGARVRVFAERRGDTEVLDKAVEVASSLTPLAGCADSAALSMAIPLPEAPDRRATVVSLQERLDEAGALEQAGKYRAALPLASDVAAKTETLDYAPIRAQALYQRASLERRTGTPTAAEATVREAIQVASTARDDTQVVQGWLLLLRTFEDQARLADALLLREGIEAAIERAGRQQAQVASLSDHIGNVLMRQGEYGEALAAHERALAIIEEVFGSDHPRLTSTLNNLGLVLERLGEYDEAQRHLERALVIDEDTLGPEHPIVASSLTNLGNVLVGQGKFDEARRVYERALAINERALGPEHPELTAPLSNLAGVLWSQGELDEARAAYERALAIDENALGPDHPNLANTLASLSGVLINQGKYAEARSNLERALAIAERALGPEHPIVANTLANLGGVLANQGEYAEALRHLERALAIREAALGPEHPYVANTLTNLGNVCCEWGKFDAAREYFERGLGIDEKALGAGHPDVAYSLTGLGKALLGLGRPKAAISHLDRAVRLRAKGDTDPGELAGSRFALAQALWDSSHDREHARELAREARDGYSAAGEEWHEELAEVRTWLKSRD